MHSVSARLASALAELPPGYLSLIFIACKEWLERHPEMRGTVIAICMEEIKAEASLRADRK